ncbi:MAG TPA: hypothetical protein VGG64_19190 [Pirellulales bacterium]|jgi:hypothetical protein
MGDVTQSLMSNAAERNESRQGASGSDVHGGLFSRLLSGIGRMIGAGHRDVGPQRQTGQGFATLSQASSGGGVQFPTNHENKLVSDVTDSLMYRAREQRERRESPSGWGVGRTNPLRSITPGIANHGFPQASNNRGDNRESDGGSILSRIAATLTDIKSILTTGHPGGALNNLRGLTGNSSGNSPDHRNGFSRLAHHAQNLGRLLVPRSAAGGAAEGAGAASGAAAGAAEAGLSTTAATVAGLAGVAGAAVLTGAALAKVPSAMHGFANSLSSGQEYLKSFNGKIAVAFGQLQQSNNRLNFQQGRATADSVKALFKSEARYNEAVQPWKNEWENIKNALSAGLNNSASDIIEVVNKLLGVNIKIEKNTRDPRDAPAWKGFLSDVAEGKFAGKTRKDR